MKAKTRGIVLFLLTLPVAGCFNPPEYSISPEIEFVAVHFKEGTTTDPTESLLLDIAFKDGDGDLGLASNQIEEPYQDVFYALASNGNVTEVAKETLDPNLPQFVKVAPGATGKLVTSRTLQDPAYVGKLPPFIDDLNSCKDYRIQTLYVREADAHIIDDTYLKIDTISVPGLGTVYVVQDVFYKRNNPNHLNIEVDFMLKQSDGSYTLFDWEKEYCESAFNQRFPVLGDKQGPLAGNLNYALTSLGIKANFSIKTLNLKIRIRDRALNVSNEVETGDFTLDKIKVQ